MSNKSEKRQRVLEKEVKKTETETQVKRVRLYLLYAYIVSTGGRNLRVFSSES